MQATTRISSTLWIAYLEQTNSIGNIKRKFLQTTLVIVKRSFNMEK